MANEFKVKNGLIVVGDLTTSGTITINGALAATQSWVTSQAYLTSASLSGYATQSYVTSAIAALIDSAPAALDTLNELAAALGDDANFSTTITNSIASKQAQLNGTGFVKVSGTTVSYDNNTYLTSYTETDTLATVTGRGSTTSTAVTFNGNVTLGNTADLRFVDLAGIFPTTGKGFDWTLNNDGARIYAIQPGSDSIDLVFQLRDNATTNDRFVFWVDEWQGPAYDKYPLIISGGTQFDLKDSALYTNTVLRLSNSGVLQNVTGNISMFTNNAGYLTSESDTLATVTGRGATTTSAITVGGLIVDTNVLVVDSVNNRVGIGTTTPSYTLDVQGAAAFASPIHVGSVTNALVTSAGTLFIAGSKLTITSTGNVGIGTTSPSEKLHVAGSSVISYSATNANYFGQANSGFGYGYIRPFNSSGLFAFDTNYTPGGGYDFAYNGSSVIRINSSGNVGIGTTSPERKLEVNGTGIVASFGGTFSPTSFAGIHFGYTEANANYKKSALVFERTDNHGQGGNASGKIHFLLNNIAAGSATSLSHSVMVIDTDAVATQGSARVGIGTTSPSTALTVNGVITATSGNSTNWNTAYSWGNHASASYATTSYVTTQINNLINGAPGVLDTLDELAAALGDDANFATTVTNSIATKAPLASPALTGTPTAPTASTATNSTQIATTAYVKNQGYITGVTNISGYSGTLLAEDNRTISPSELTANRLGFGFTSWTNNNAAPYADFLHLRSYGDTSGGNDNLVMFRKDAIGMRIYQQAFGSGTAYSTFKDVAFTDSSITGNAATATTLETARTIGGVSFNGSANINLPGVNTTGNQNTTGSAATLTTARTLTIGNTGKTFNGEANVSWSLAEIGAQPAGSYADASHTHTSLSSVNFNNGDLTNINSIQIGDPGPGEGLIFNGGNGWKIYESPNDLTTNTGGNLQFVKGTTRVMTLDTSNNVYFLGSITASGYNDSNWNTAYGWGNHASAGYALDSSLANYLPLSGGVIGGGVTINGNLTVNGTITENSSLKLKENVETSEGNLEKVVNLRPVTYNKIGSQTTELGLIAEEVAEVYPEFVQYDENGEPIGVNYSRLTAALIGAVKELNEQLQELKRNK